MTLRPLARLALVALATGGVLAGTTGVLTPTASADQGHRPAVQGPVVPGTEVIGSTLLERSRGLSTLHSPTSTGTLARKFK